MFHDLAFAVIDEQHRFGVHQRLALQMKGGEGGANMLVMTATPIPRTLLMTHYGDLDVSKLTEKPAGRKPIITKAVPTDTMEKLIDRIRVQLAEGAQVYWVCPLIESSEVSELAAAEERHAHLKQIFGETVGLLHGAMTSAAKDATMAAFAKNELKILVATTVIEVGVNVPNANIMVIEHAERFGLAQLHQLRGRVGRGIAREFLHAALRAALGRDGKRASRDDGGHGGRLPDRGKGSGVARGRGGSGRAAKWPAGVPRRGRAGISNAAGGCARRRQADPGAGSVAHQSRADRRCARCSISSSATKPCGCSGRPRSSPARCRRACASVPAGRASPCRRRSRPWLRLRRSS